MTQADAILERSPRPPTHAYFVIALICSGSFAANATTQRCRLAAIAYGRERARANNLGGHVRVAATAADS